MDARSLRRGADVDSFHGVVAATRPGVGVGPPTAAAPGAVPVHGSVPPLLSSWMRAPLAAARLVLRCRRDLGPLIVVLCSGPHPCALHKHFAVSRVFSSQHGGTVEPHTTGDPLRGVLQGPPGVVISHFLLRGFGAYNPLRRTDEAYLYSATARSPFQEPVLVQPPPPIHVHVQLRQKLAPET
jgi:hypothetical protein